MDIQTALKIIADSGMSDAEIGEKIGAPQPTITRLRNGIHKTTSYERGKEIIDLAASIASAVVPLPKDLTACIAEHLDRRAHKETR